MKKKLYYVMCCLFIITGLSFLVCEFITILNATDSLAAYYTHNISDLIVPFSVTGYSPLCEFFRVNLYFIAASCLFSFNFLFQDKIRKVNIWFYVFSILSSVGLTLVATFYTKGEYQFWHVVGAVLVFVSANFVILLTLLYNTFSENKLYKKYCLVSLIIGSICGVLLFIPVYPFRSVVERLTIYPFIIFQVVTGIYLFYLQYKKDKTEKITQTKTENNT